MSTTAARSIHAAPKRTRDAVVRSATPSEVGTVVELARRLHAESMYRFLPFDTRKVGVLIAWCASQPDCFGRIAEVDGMVMGFLGGKLTTYPFCNEPFAYDLGFYVAQERRASRAAVALLSAFRIWSKEKGAREVTISASSGIESKRVGAFLERQGLKAVGGIYRQRLDVE